MKLIYDEHKCIGCAACQIVFPEIWIMNNNTGKAELLGGTLNKNKYVLSIFPDEQLKAKKSQQACVSKAIRIE